MFCKRLPNRIVTVQNRIIFFSPLGKVVEASRTPLVVVNPLSKSSFHQSSVYWHHLKKGEKRKMNKPLTRKAKFRISSVHNQNWNKLNSSRAAYLISHHTPQLYQWQTCCTVVIRDLETENVCSNWVSSMIDAKLVVFIAWHSVPQPMCRPDKTAAATTQLRYCWQVYCICSNLHPCQNYWCL